MASDRQVRSDRRAGPRPRPHGRLPPRGVLPPPGRPRLGQDDRRPPVRPRPGQGRGEPCLYITLTESTRDLENACRSHGWSLDGLEVCDLTEVAANLAGEPQGVRLPPVRDRARRDDPGRSSPRSSRSKPQHVVFDGLSELRLLSGDPLRYRRQLLALKQFFAERKVTVLLLDDRSSPFGDIQPESLVGGNIVLERILPQYGRARRRLYVTKVRGVELPRGLPRLRDRPRAGSSSTPGSSPPSTTSGSSAQLLPERRREPRRDARRRAHDRHDDAAARPGRGRQVDRRHAVRRGRPEDGRTKAAVYMFDEVIDTLFDRSEKLCLGQDGRPPRVHQADGLLHAQQVDPAELSAGAFAHEVRRAVEAGRKVIVIDSLNGYMNAMPEERFLTTHLHELFAYLNQKGVVTIMVVAQHGLIVGGDGEATST